MTAARAPEAKIDPREAGERMVRLVEERGYLGAILGSDPATVERFKTVLLGPHRQPQGPPASPRRWSRRCARRRCGTSSPTATRRPTGTASGRSTRPTSKSPPAESYGALPQPAGPVRGRRRDDDADEFTFEKGAVPRLVHRPKMFGDRGNRIGAYALVQLNTGFVRPIVLNEEQIQKRRKVARDSEKGPWLDWEDEMWRKTALRACMSLVPIERGVKAALAVEATKYPELATPEPMLSLPEPPASVPTSLLAARAAFVGEPEPGLSGRRV